MTGGTELYNTENKPTPEGLTTLPRDYSGLSRTSPPPIAPGVPPLGPPLPGDLGRPIRNAQIPVPRTSRLFATTNTRERPTTPTALPATTIADHTAGTLTGRVEPPPFDPDSILNMQDRKLAFLTAAVDRKTVSPDRLANPASRYVVQAGAAIPAALITGIRSDLPGQVTAQVTEHVYDSPTGKYLLIPQGSKLIGVYDSQISFGQDRVLLVWTRLIMPNGRSIVLERQPGADTQGFAGLEDEVDHHWGRLFTRGSTDSLNQTGQQVVRRNLNIQPTITIRPGFPVRVIINRDLVLSPYRS